MTVDDPAVPVDAEELEQLVRYLRDSPGEIAGAVVPGSMGGDAVLARLQEVLDSELKIHDAGHPVVPDTLGDLAAELAVSDTMLVVRLDRPRTASQSERPAFWQRMNFQRERLAQGRLRVLLILDPEAEQHLAAVADDLRDWVFLFRFPAAVPTGSGLQLEMPDRGGTPRNDALLAALRAQLERGRDELPPRRLMKERVLPLLYEAVTHTARDEVFRIWQEELEGGAAWQRYRRSLPAIDDLSVTDAQRLGRDLIAIQAAASMAGDRELANEAAAEAVEVYRGLAEHQPDTFLPDLAWALNKMGMRLSDLGRREDALAITQQAVDMYQQLAENRPDAFLPGLAAALNNMGIRLGNLGRREDALSVTQQAVDLYLKLAEDHADAFLPGLTSALSNLGMQLSNLGRREDALAVTQRVVDVYRQLAEDRPDPFLPHLASALHNLGKFLSELGRREDALAATQQAVDIHRKLAEDRPDPFLPHFAGSLLLLGSLHLMAMHPSDAMESLAEGLKIIRPIAKQYPQTYGGIASDLARTLQRAAAQANIPIPGDLAPELENS